MAESLAWVDASGTVHPLDVRGEVQVIQSPAGRFSPPVDFTDDPVPGQSGTRLRQLRYESVETTIPLIVSAPTSAELRQRIREWIRRFDPTRGDGRILSQVDGLAARELVCRYIGGMEGNESQGWQRDQRFVAVFRAFDPFWQDATDRTSVISSADLIDPFFPFPPMTLSPAATLGTVVVDNQGDADSWPVWVLEGPATGLTLTNLTSGATFQLEGLTVAEGDTVTVDTRPGVKTVRDQDDVNLFGKRVAGSQLWPLVGGTQTVEVEATDTTDASRVTLTWRQRYLSA